MAEFEPKPNFCDPANRRMKFPYTITAKLAQFPFKFYFKNNWIFRYYFYGVVASIPIFYYLTKLSNSPGNIAKWEEIHRKEAESHFDK